MHDDTYLQTCMAAAFRLRNYAAQYGGIAMLTDEALFEYDFSPIEENEWFFALCPAE